MKNFLNLCVTIITSLVYLFCLDWLPTDDAKAIGVQVRDGDK